MNCLTESSHMVTHNDAPITDNKQFMVWRTALAATDRPFGPITHTRTTRDRQTLRKKKRTEERRSRGRERGARVTIVLFGQEGDRDPDPFPCFLSFLSRASLCPVCVYVWTGRREG